MDAVKYFEEKSRVLNSLGKNGAGCRGVLCDDCLFSSINNGMNISCAELEIDYPKEAVAIVEKWSQEHPRKTMLSDLLEKYPKVSLEKNGTPAFCPEELGYCEKAYCDINDLNCVKCWNRPWEEYEKLKEQGRLIELPCAVGDRIYRINQGASIPIIEMRVIGLLCNNAFIRIDAAAENDLSESCYFLEDFGKTVFLTKEEALAKLAEIRGTK